MGKTEAISCFGALISKLYHTPGCIMDPQSSWLHAADEDGSAALGTELCPTTFSLIFSHGDTAMRDFLCAPARLVRRKSFLTSHHAANSPSHNRTEAPAK